MLQGQLAMSKSVATAIMSHARGRTTRTTRWQLATVVGRTSSMCQHRLQCHGTTLLPCSSPKFPISGGTYSGRTKSPPRACASPLCYLWQAQSYHRLTPHTRPAHGRPWRRPFKACTRCAGAKQSRPVQWIERVRWARDAGKRCIGGTLDGIIPPRGTGHRHAHNANRPLWAQDVVGGASRQALYAVTALPAAQGRLHALHGTVAAQRAVDGGPGAVAVLTPGARDATCLGTRDARGEVARPNG